MSHLKPKVNISASMIQDWYGCNYEIYFLFRNDDIQRISGFAETYNAELFSGDWDVL